MGDCMISEEYLLMLHPGDDSPESGKYRRVPVIGEKLNNLNGSKQSLLVLSGLTG